jgi:hypothetical protein
MLASFAATAAMADAVDPTVIIRKVDPPPIAITSPDQTFDITANASHNVFAFQNQTESPSPRSLDLFGANVELLFSCGDSAGDDIFRHALRTQAAALDTIISSSAPATAFTGITPATCTTDDKGGGDDINARSIIITTKRQIAWMVSFSRIRWNPKALRLTAPER